MAAARRLGFLVHVFDHPVVVLYPCAKFGCIRCSSFDNVQVLVFCKYRLENVYSRHQNEGLGIWLPRLGAASTRLQKALSCTETSYMTYSSSKSVNSSGISYYLNEYVSVRGQPYIHTCRPTSTRRRICSVTFTIGFDITSRAILPGGWPIRPILGFWEAKFPKMGDSLHKTPIKTTVQNLTPLALCSPEKSVTVQTNKKVKKMRFSCLRVLLFKVINLPPPPIMTGRNIAVVVRDWGAHFLT